MALGEDDQIVRILNSGNGHDATRDAVGAYVRDLRREGQAKDAILAGMQVLRRSVSDEQEDVLLEVMDFLVGWCSPHARID